ncbi:MAG: amidohydrolase family protein [Candidatus Riflebacteria bacterium]|nr:amidohydrolase family protein [Candidatus Riflebacteria bacterium]
MKSQTSERNPTTEQFVFPEYVGKIIDFHAHLHLHIEEFISCKKRGACKALADPLRPFLFRAIWAPFEKFGYRYVIKSGSPFEKPMERILARILRAIPQQNSDGLITAMDSQGIGKSVVLALPPFVPNSEILQSAQKFSRLIPFISPIPPSDPSGQITGLIAKGGKGVKIHPTLQGFQPDCEFSIEAAKTAGRIKVPVVIHAGGSGMLFGRRCAPKIPPKAFSRLAKNAPDAKIVVAHTGLWENEEIIRNLAKLENVTLDVSFQHPEIIRKIYETFGPKRMIFGTDTPIGKPGIILKNLSKCNFKEKDLERILFLNAQNLLSQQ